MRMLAGNLQAGLLPANLDKINTTVQQGCFLRPEGEYTKGCLRASCQSMESRQNFMFEQIYENILKRQDKFSR